MVKLIGGVKTGRFTEALNSEYVSTFGRHTCARTLRDNQVRQKTKVSLHTETKAKETKTGQMRRGTSCRRLPNRWDSIKSFFVLLMTNYISDGGVIERQRGSCSVPDCFLNEESYQGRFGEMAPPLHTCDRQWKSTHSFTVAAQHACSSTPAHMNRLVTIIQSLSC